MNLATLRLQCAQQVGLIAETRIVARKDIRSRAFILGLFDRPFALHIKVFQEELAVVAEIMKRG